MPMLVLDAMCARIKDNLVTPSDLRVVDRGGNNVSIILSHNIQYQCMLAHKDNAFVISICGIDVHVSTANQVIATALRVMDDYQSQLDIIGEGVKSVPINCSPTLTLDLTGLSPNQVARIVTITHEQP